MAKSVAVFIQMYPSIPPQTISTAYNSSTFDPSTITQHNETHPISDINMNISTRKRKKPVYSQHVRWTQQEDNLLRHLVSIFGENDWRHLAKEMNHRNPRQCRERWKYYLCPNLNVAEWTPEEDELILQKREELGPKWIMMKKFFVGRTDAMIKTRYNALVRNRKKSMKIQENNIVQNFNRKLEIEKENGLGNKKNFIKSNYLQQVLA